MSFDFVVYYQCSLITIPETIHIIALHPFIMLTIFKGLFLFFQGHNGFQSPYVFASLYHGLVALVQLITNVYISF